jgi:hypothetical protein
MRWHPFQRTALSRRSRYQPSDRARPTVEQLEDRRLLSINVLTYHYDLSRTGADLNETTLTPANVNSTTFGKLFVDPVDGKVNAQPLYVANLAIPGKGTHNVLFVATEHDTIYALDADHFTGINGTPLWKVSLLGTGEVPSDNRGCGQITPEIGITATPVIDLSTDTMYVVAMSKLVSGSTTTYFQRLHALDITTGAEKFGGPVTITASAPGTGDGGSTVTFQAANQVNRPGLLLLNNVVYTFWGSHCDAGVYYGWIIAYDATTLKQLSVFNVDPNLQKGSVWASGVAPAAGSAGNIFLMTGNGGFDANTGGPDYGDTFLRLSTSSGLKVAGFFTPDNQQFLNQNDLDLGSGGVLLLPSNVGSSAHRYLAIGAGKGATIYLIDRVNPGGFDPNTDHVVQELTSVINKEYGAPAYFNGTVYIGSVSDPLMAFSISNAVLSTSPTSQTSTVFGYPGTTPSISANGTTNGIVWAAENGNVAVLHAFDATDLSKELYNSNQAANNRDHFGMGNKFITPVIANGKVYVGTTTGVAVFGLLPAARNQSQPAEQAATDTPPAGNGANVGDADTPASLELAGLYLAQLALGPAGNGHAGAVPPVLLGSPQAGGGAPRLSFDLNQLSPPTSQNGTEEDLHAQAVARALAGFRRGSDQLDITQDMLVEVLAAGA